MRVVFSPQLKFIYIYIYTITLEEGILFAHLFASQTTLDLNALPPDMRALDLNIYPNLDRHIDNSPPLTNQRYTQSIFIVETIETDPSRSSYMGVDFLKHRSECTSYIRCEFRQPKNKSRFRKGPTLTGLAIYAHHIWPYTNLNHSNGVIIYIPYTCTCFS